MPDQTTPTESRLCAEKHRLLRDLESSLANYSRSIAALSDNVAARGEFHAELDASNELFEAYEQARQACTVHVDSHGC